LECLCLSVMKKQQFYNNRFLLLAMVVLFSLTPCKVKASWFEIFDASYEQTLNQSKVAYSCNTSSFISQKVLGSKSKVSAVSNTVVFKKMVSFESKVIKNFVFTKVISLQLPPKYILYKQFKFDVV
jgi:hypothetical protein